MIVCIFISWHSIISQSVAFYKNHLDAQINAKQCLRNITENKSKEIKTYLFAGPKCIVHWPSPPSPGSSSSCQRSDCARAGAPLPPRRLGSRAATGHRGRDKDPTRSPWTSPISLSPPHCDALLWNSTTERCRGRPPVETVATNSFSLR